MMRLRNDGKFRPYSSFLRLIRLLIARNSRCDIKEVKNKRGCLTAVDDQKDRDICFAYALRDVLYADSYLNGQPYLIYIQDMFQYLHLVYPPPPEVKYDPEDTNWGKGVSNTLHSALLYTQFKRVLLDSDYPFMGSMEPDLKFDDRIKGPLITVDGGWYIKDTDHVACRAELKKCPLVGTLKLTHELDNWKDKDHIYMIPRKKKEARRLKRHEEPTVYHSVLIVGYGNEKGKSYYLIKSSWGLGWGYKGYAKISQEAFEGNGDFARPLGTISSTSFVHQLGSTTNVMLRRMIQKARKVLIGPNLACLNNGKS